MEIRTLVSPADGQMKYLHVQVVDIAPGESRVDCSLPGMDVYYYVVSGFGRLDVDAYGYALSAQSGVFIPAENPHWLSNSGAMDMKLVRYFTPAKED